nr:ABC transporter substrate-binding protein [Micromonospora sp. DSM 115978]
MSATRSICSVAAVVIFAATSVACAAQGIDTASADADCQSPGVTEDSVEVGLLYPDSGTLAGAFNGARAGFDARIGLANANGGVNGRLIEYQWRDDEGDPPTNLAMSEELVMQEEVFAILQSSTVASGSAQYLDDNGVPVIGLAVEPEWSDHNNMFAFSYSFTEGESVDTFGNFLRAQGGTR